MNWFLMHLLVLLTLVGSITYFDFVSFRIPDVLNLALAIFGISWQVSTFGSLSFSSILSALILLAGFWLVREIHFRARGKLGLGMGDVKMAGALGLWLSPISIPFFLLVASVSAMIFYVARLPFSKEVRVPFGPFLGCGLISVWMWENI